jgi:hypothetical protein
MVYMINCFLICGEARPEFVGSHRLAQWPVKNHVLQCSGLGYTAFLKLTFN